MNANEKLTALADEVRELSGTTTTKGLDDMKNDVDAANAEISEQMGLIAQITAALEGKAGGTASEDLNAELTEYASLNTEFEAVINSLPNAGGSGGGSIETCTLTIDMDWATDYHPLCIVTTLIDSQPTIQIVNSSTVFTNLIKNNKIICCYPEGYGYHFEQGIPGYMTEQIYSYLVLDGAPTVMRAITILEDSTIIFH
jgi:hypothetical protein